MSYWAIMSLVVGTQILTFSYLFPMSANSVVFIAESAVKGLYPVFTILILAVIPARWKDSIAHFRISSPLPGSDSFSRWAKEDPRINCDKFKSLGRIPKRGKAQNTLWYSKLYQPLKHQPEVVFVHRRYILFRDLAVIQSALILCGLIASPFAGLPYYWLGIAILLYGLFVTAANNTGVRFVQTVMAVWQPETA
jgi:hypothetical protein